MTIKVDNILLVLSQTGKTGWFSIEILIFEIVQTKTGYWPDRFSVRRRLF
jgi:hypothetical protein